MMDDEINKEGGMELSARGPKGRKRIELHFNNCAVISYIISHLYTYIKK